jgi:5'-deoxynucleotidase YfbR-like HD superfamily hydrolase
MSAYTRLIQQYEAQSVPEARFVRAVDKLMVLLIHFPNSGVVLRNNYTYDSFLKCEDDLLTRDGYKYGEFNLIMELRRELGKELADTYLRKG